MHSKTRTNAFEQIQSLPHATTKAAGRERIHAWLARLALPWPQRVLVGAAVLLVVPTLFGGFALDDYVIFYQMDGPRDGEWSGSGPFDLFEWLTPDHNHRLIDGGGMPWWTYEHARLAFMRPVSSWTHAIDNTLFGANAFWSHLHSLIWFGLLVMLALRAYRELIDDRWVVGVASAMFALDSAHGSAVGWISNRNASIVAVVGLIALLCHHRRQHGASRTTAAIGWVCFALSLLSGESALGVFGYLFAYALTYEPKPLRARALSIAPHVAMLCAWAVARAALGYGSYGLGAYVDPVHEPLEFLRLLPERFAILFSSQMTRVGADLYDLVPDRFRPMQLTWAVLVCIEFVWLCGPTLRRERHLRFWVIGMLLSILPVTATVPNDRLLTLVGLGMMPVLAFAIHDTLRGTESATDATRSFEARLRVFCAFALLFGHLVVDPLLLPTTAMSPSLIGRWAAHADAALPATPELRNQTLIVAAVPDSVLLSYVPVMRSIEGRPRPEKLYWLAATPSAASFERRGPNVLRVTAPDGLYDRRSEARSHGLQLRRGERVQLSQMTVDVIELTPDGRPSVCDFSFREPLESGRYVWRTWDAGEIREFRVPAIGETLPLKTG